MEKKYEDLTGKKFASWTVLSFIRKHHETIWLCQCKCGLKKEINRGSLVSEATTQCRKCYSKKKNIHDTNIITPTEYGRIRYAANRRGIPFNISIEYCQKLFNEQNGKCLLTNLPIEFAKSSQGAGHGETSASLDRIDVLKGYEPNNVQWIHKDVNRMKWALSQDYFHKLCELVYKNRNRELPKIVLEGQQIRREAKKRVKLSNQDIIDIRNKHSRGIKGKELAKEYNCTPGNISYIVNNSSRKDVK